jgi:F-type H+-transporting ATPase subunit gamma
MSAQTGAADTPAARAGPCLAVLFGSDQGLCGAYNDRVVTAACEFIRKTAGDVRTAVIGRRAHDMLALKGVEAVFSARAPTSLEGVNSQAVELAADVFERHCELDAARMVFVYNAYESMGRFKEKCLQVLPPPRDLAETDTAYSFACDPLLTTVVGDLFASLAEEYFFIQFFRALLESHCSENGARLMSMTAAGRNIEDTLAELTREYQTARQESITAELLDVIGGAEALQTGGGVPPVRKQGVTTRAGEPAAA